MINPAALMKLKGTKKTLENEHPEFLTLVKKAVFGDLLEENGQVTLTVVKADGTSASETITITAADIEALAQVKAIRS